MNSTLLSRVSTSLYLNTGRLRRRGTGRAVHEGGERPERSHWSVITHDQEPVRRRATRRRSLATRTSPQGRVGLQHPLRDRPVTRRIRYSHTKGGVLDGKGRFRGVDQRERVRVMKGPSCAGQSPAARVGYKAQKQYAWRSSPSPDSDHALHGGAGRRAPRRRPTRAPSRREEDGDAEWRPSPAKPAAVRQSYRRVRRSRRPVVPAAAKKETNS
jgi:hypothetical protein